MSRLILTVMLSALIADFGEGCAQTNQRRIPYSSQVPITDQLLPSDREVEVYRQPVSPPHVMEPRQQNYEQEIQWLRLNDIVALVRVEDVQADLVERGTWIETKVGVRIDQLVHSNLKEPPANEIQFTLAGGEMQIGATRVTAGVVPQLKKGDRYLVILLAQPRIRLIRAYRVSADGVLEPGESSTALDHPSHTHLIGKKVAEVIQSLRRQ